MWATFLQVHVGLYAHEGTTRRALDGGHNALQYAIGTVCRSRYR